MKYILILTLILIGCSDGSGSGSATKKSIIAIGDSLCAAGWPLLLNDYDVDNRCIGGQGLVGSAWGIIYQHEYKYADHTIIALGGNDAIAGIDTDSFELAYRSLVNVVSNPICLLPPLTNHLEIAALIIEYRNRIITFCPVILYSTPSDGEDGIHYTDEAHRINADTILSAI